MSYYAYGNGDIEFTSQLDTGSDSFKTLLKLFEKAWVEVEIHPKGNNCGGVTALCLHDDGNFEEEALLGAFEYAESFGIKEASMYYNDEFGEKWRYIFRSGEFVWEGGEVQYNNGFPDWHLIKDEWPPVPGAYICSVTDNARCGTGTWIDLVSFYGDREAGHSSDYYVVAWMPIPKPIEQEAMPA